MYTKAELREMINDILTDKGFGEDAEEIADDVVERLDEEGAFESDDDDEDDE